VRIGVDDGLQLSFVGAVPPVTVRVVAADEAFVGAADIGCGRGIGQAERRKRLGIAECGPATGGLAGFCGGGEQVVRVAEGEGRLALWPQRLFPTGERALRLVDFIRRQAIEEIIAGVEGPDMIEAEELPAAFAAGQAIRARRAEFTDKRAAWVVAAGGIGAFDAAVQALGSFRRVRRFGGDGRRSLVGELFLSVIDGSKLGEDRIWAKRQTKWRRGCVPHWRRRC
jgi:hypothetical protein